MEQKTESRHFGAAVLLNVVILAASNLVALAIVSVIPGWLGAVAIGSALGLLWAWWTQARFAEFVLATMTVVMISEAAIPLWYGREALRGAPAHFGLLGTAAIGVLFGAILFRRERPLTDRNPRDSVSTY